MRFRWVRIAASFLTFAILPSLTFSQTAATDEGKRKVKSKTAPAYPELARRMSVSGRVKIEVIITPDGHVRSHPCTRRAPAAGAGLPGFIEGVEVLSGCGRNHASRRMRFSRQQLVALGTLGFLFELF